MRRKRRKYGGPLVVLDFSGENFLGLLKKLSW